MTNWFHVPVSATASVTSCRRKPQLRSIPYESATPTAGPPGARYVDALLDIERTKAFRKLSRGSAACQGGA